jgi:hypothetical protein
MKDWIEYLQKMLAFNNLEMLSSKGKTSHAKMEEVVRQELQKFLGRRSFK